MSNWVKQIFQPLSLAPSKCSPSARGGLLCFEKEDQDDEGQHVRHDGEEIRIVTGQAQLVYQLIAEGSAETEEHRGPERCTDIPVAEDQGGNRQVSVTDVAGGREVCHRIGEPYRPSRQSRRKYYSQRSLLTSTPAASSCGDCRRRPRGGRIWSCTERRKASAATTMMMKAKGRCSGRDRRSRVSSIGRVWYISEPRQLNWWSPDPVTAPVMTLDKKEVRALGQNIDNHAGDRHF